MMNDEAAYEPDFQEEIDYLFRNVGAVKGLENSPLVDFASIKEKLPEALLEVFQKFGLAHLYGGRLLLCNPRDFEPVIHLLFDGDPDFNPQQIGVFAYSQFGILLCWDETNWIIEINLQDAIVTCKGFLHPDRKRAETSSIVTALTSFENIDLDWEDDDGKTLFTRAQKALGPLAYGECYGFFPALPLGGPSRLENLRRVKAVEHFAMRAQLQEFKLRDYLSRPIQDVRLIGSQP